MRTQFTKRIAEVIATGFFLDMLNPLYRGKNFKFSEFDIEGWVVNHMGISYTRTPTRQERELAASVARRTWERNIKRVGDGIPLEAR